MAFTYSLVTVNNLAVGDQVRAAVAADGHAYVFPVPTTGGASFQQQFVLFTQQQYLLELIVG